MKNLKKKILFLFISRKKNFYILIFRIIFSILALAVIEYLFIKLGIAYLTTNCY